MLPHHFVDFFVYFNISQLYFAHGRGELISNKRGRIIQQKSLEGFVQLLHHEDLLFQVIKEPKTPRSLLHGLAITNGCFLSGHPSEGWAGT